MTDLSAVRIAVLNHADPQVQIEREEAAERHAFLAREKAHHEAREEALREAVDGGHFERDVYSAYPTPSAYTAPCGCCGRYEKECDGDSVWTEFRWFEECDWEGR